METTRFILLLALGLVLTMLWQAWQEDYGQPTEPVTATLQENDFEPSLKESADIPTVEEEVGAVADAIPQTTTETESLAGQLINIKTDLFDIDINTRGATIERLALLNYPVEKDRPDNPVLLLKNKADEFYWLQSGLLSKSDSANHKTIFSVDSDTYQLSGEQLEIDFTHETPGGVVFVKTYTFNKGSYLVDLKHRVINNSGADWRGSAYAQINRTEPADSGSFFLYTYTGAVVSSPDNRYEKIDFSEIINDKFTAEFPNAWVAMLQHYFFTALLPGDINDTYRYYTLNPDNKSYVIGAVTPVSSVSSGDSADFLQHVYFGPKLQKELDQIADGLELTVDYGIFWFIAKPLYWVLDNIHDYVGNWGWSIILVTLFLKIIFYRLSAAGYRSMANMRRVQPRLVAIKERYQNDRARLNQAMMDIYKEEKINPLGGCFPILVQIPVFISLYWVLLETVELRQSPFALWIDDLSSPDPYFVLPALMGVTMYVQQKLNPAPMDPVQEKIMSFLPAMFTVFFLFFPSGLVLYWVANNILSIAQQWMITRSLEKTQP
ncbi:MAG: membrane protein insertase YidC [Pseudomonadota bacterium]